MNKLDRRWNASERIREQWIRYRLRGIFPWTEYPAIASDESEKSPSHPSHPLVIAEWSPPPTAPLFNVLVVRTNLRAKVFFSREPRERSGPLSTVLSFLVDAPLDSCTLSLPLECDGYFSRPYARRRIAQGRGGSGERMNGFVRWMLGI